MTKYPRSYNIQNIDPNLLITWNLSKTLLNQSYNKQKLYIEGKT